jgi:hypothetical protein
VFSSTRMPVVSLPLTLTSRETGVIRTRSIQALPSAGVELEFTGDDDRLIGYAGALPVRLLAEQGDLRAGLSATMRRRGFDPVYDRGRSWST